jgi:hypothetical protein
LSYRLKVSEYAFDAQPVQVIGAEFVAEVVVEVAVGGGADRVEMDCSCSASASDELDDVGEGFASTTITVRVDVAVLPQVSVAT